ncbi:MAG: hypothetical protein QG597_1772, partial [Actinomycetota bacterium]|nr:hypothetical protein [Actinomycetota bacterium]
PGQEVDRKISPPAPSSAGHDRPERSGACQSLVPRQHAAPTRKQGRRPNPRHSSEYSEESHITILMNNGAKAPIPRQANPSRPDSSDGETMATAQAASRQDAPSAIGPHPRPKAVSSLPPPVMRLKGSFHGASPDFLFRPPRRGAKPGSIFMSPYYSTIAALRQPRRQPASNSAQGRWKWPGSCEECGNRCSGRLPGSVGRFAGRQQRRGKGRFPASGRARGIR